MSNSNISHKEANEIKELLVMINNKLSQLENRIEKIEKSAKNMDDHISFVDDVYESVKSPFHRVMNLVSFRYSSNSGELPSPVTKPVIEE